MKLGFEILKPVKIELIAISIFFLFAGNLSMAQDFSITQIEQEGARLSIFYNISDPDKSTSYTVKLYSSKDNYENPLINVSGDVGLEVKPGENKKIVLDFEQEFGDNFEAKLDFQIRGSVYKPFIKLSTSYKKMRRGKSYSFVWTGGREDETINFELIKGNKIVSKISSINNTKRYNLTLPSDSKTGSNYQLRMFNSSDENRMVYTNEFSIKPRISLLLKTLPLIAAGAIAIIISQPAKSDRLPDPIKPGSN